MDTNATKAASPTTATELPLNQTNTASASGALAATASAQPSPAPPDVPAYVADPADYRLVIDKDPVSGSLVYKTVDRLSGEVISEYPRDKLLKLGANLDYTAGSVFNSKV